MEIKVKEDVLKASQRWWLLTFPSTLLKFNWQIKLYVFNVCSGMIWYMYTLWNVYHNQHIHYFIWLPHVCVFVCVCVQMVRSILLTKFQCIIHNTIFAMPSITSSEMISYNWKSLPICSRGSQNQTQVQVLFAQKSMFKR